jgi:hypothetical protein
VGVPKELLKYLLPVIIFYVIGDYATTLIGLHLGYAELNPIMGALVTDPFSFLAAKVFMVLLLCVYYESTQWKYRYTPFVFASAIGVLLTVNNAYLILIAL